MTRALFCGGRSFRDLELMERAFEEIRPTMVIHGGAYGADSLADKVAKRNGIDRVACPANWTKHGNSAGPIRNIFMATFFKPDVVVAMPGNKGTRHMINTARKHGIKVVTYGDHNDG